MTDLGQIYVIEFSTGLVKVGMSKNATKRQIQHRADAGRFGITISDHWHSKLHQGYRETEQHLIEWAASVAGSARNGAEYFNGVRFAEAVEYAQSLVLESLADTRLTLDQVAAQSGCSVGLVKKWIKYGDLPAERVGDSWRVSSGKLEKWVDSWPTPNDPPSPRKSLAEHLAGHPYPIECPDGEGCAVCTESHGGVPHWWPAEKREKEQALLMSVLNSVWAGMSPAVPPTPWNPRGSRRSA